MIKRGLLLLFLVLFLVGCGSDDTPKAQCEIDSECPDRAPCKDGICTGGKCRFAEKTDCCGNGECEASESTCSCGLDCTPACEGEVVFKGENNYKKTAKFFDYSCVNDECQIKYDAGRIDPLQEYHTMNKNNMVIGVEVSYIQPFEISHGELELEIELKSYDKEALRTPINVTDIRILDRSQLLGRKSDEVFTFKKIGDKHTTKVPVSYSMAFPEEEKNVQIAIDHNFMALDRITVKDSEGITQKDGNGQILYAYIDDELTIVTGSVRLGEKIVFIDPNYDVVKVDFSQE